jgi:hypothetical protein
MGRQEEKTMNKYEAAEQKNGEPGIELHAVGCADIQKKNRVSVGTYASAQDAVADYFSDLISEGATVEEQMGDCKVMPCAKAVR